MSGSLHSATLGHLVIHDSDLNLSVLEKWFEACRLESVGLQRVVVSRH